MAQRLTEVVNNSDPKLVTELKQLNEIASSEGLTIAEYMQREAQKIQDLK